ncbi:MAG: uroporphyrinogen decarboxylase [Alphaproteobacteria bacterium]|nr:uroporphyrinogen decarboxylase [Alphaproteobacteria bacterium]
METEPTKPLLRALAGETLSVPPWWLMRQAGRYLPEYRQLRATAKSFIELCLNPALAAELTLQPIRRYGMNGAILFSDILMLPYALGQNLTFHERDGPVLERIESSAGVARLDPGRIASTLDPVFESVARVRAALDARTALIGFAGAPWTVATYMVEGRGSRDFRLTKIWAYRDLQGFNGLIELLVESTIEYLARQIEAGAEVVQLFDSWAGALPERAFVRWVIEPTKQIVTGLKTRFPDCAIIGFPRAAGVLHERYLRETGVSGISLDTAVPPEYARQTLQPHGVVQGNLDPVLLIAGGAALEEAVHGLLRVLAGRHYIFNLGHGVLPETPPENVQALARLLAEPIAS